MKEAVHFPDGWSNGIAVRGIPILNTYPDKVVWVSSGTGSNSNSGKTQSKPVPSITKALTKLTTGKGGMIICLPGHAETISAAAGLVLDIADVTIVALGNGTNRATITFATDTAADIDFDAANVIMRGFRFVGNIAALAAPIDLNAAGCGLIGNDFYCTSATTDFNITIITDAAANDVVIQGNNFYYGTSLATTAVSNTSTECIRLVGADRAKIIGNYFFGNFTTSVINGITTASKEIEISYNRIGNLDTNNIAGLIDLVAACTGDISYNRCQSGYATGIAGLIDPASCSMTDNKCTNLDSETGGVIGVLST